MPLYLVFTIVVCGLVIVLLIVIWVVISKYSGPVGPAAPTPVIPVPAPPLPPPPPPASPPPPSVPTIRFITRPPTVGQGPGKRGTFVYKAENDIGLPVRSRQTLIELAAGNGGAIVRLDGAVLKYWDFADAPVLFRIETDDSGPDAGEIDIVVELNDHIGPATLTATDVDSGARVTANFNGVP